VRLFAVDPEYLGAGFLDNLALLLDRRGVNPVLGVQNPALALRFRFEHSFDTRKRMLQRIGLGESVAVEIIRAVAEVAGERFFHDGELVPLEGRDCNRLVSYGRRADVNDIHLIEQLLKALVSTNSALFGIARSLVGVNGKDALNLNVCAVDLPETFEVKRRRKTRSDYTGPNRFFLHLILTCQVKG
jgi:hypothetical protein